MRHFLWVIPVPIPFPVSSNSTYPWTYAEMLSNTLCSIAMIDLFVSTVEYSVSEIVALVSFMILKCMAVLLSPNNVWKSGLITHDSRFDFSPPTVSYLNTPLNFAVKITQD